MKRGRDEMDLFKSHHLMCLTWLWVVKVDPMIKRCVNKDIVKKITGYLKLDLQNSINGLQLHLLDDIWFWKSKHRHEYYRPCVGCLKPIEWLRLTDADLSCGDCTRVCTDDHTRCCKIWTHSIVSKCFEPFRKIYILPEK